MPKFDDVKFSPKLPTYGTLKFFLMTMFYKGLTDEESLEAAQDCPELPTEKTTIGSVRRRRYELQDDGHNIVSNAHAEQLRLSLNLSRLWAEARLGVGKIPTDPARLH
jgi:hypothetical protein